MLALTTTYLRSNHYKIWDLYGTKKTVFAAKTTIRNIADRRFTPFLRYLSQLMKTEELATQRKKLHRQAKNTPDLFNEDIILHRTPKPVILKSTRHGPEADYIDGEELREILDS